MSKLLLIISVLITSLSVVLSKVVRHSKMMAYYMNVKMDFYDI